MYSLIISFLLLFINSGVHHSSSVYPSHYYPIEIAAPDKKSDLKDALDSALSYIKKALNSSSIDDLQSYARKAKNYASDAESLADDLNLDDIEDYCYKGYRYARVAEGEDNIKDALEYLTIARKALQDAYNSL